MLEILHLAASVALGSISAGLVFLAGRNHAESSHRAAFTASPERLVWALRNDLEWIVWQRALSDAAETVLWHPTQQVALHSDGFFEFRGDGVSFYGSGRMKDLYKQLLITALERRMADRTLASVEKLLLMEQNQ